MKQLVEWFSVADKMPVESKKMFIICQAKGSKGIYFYHTMAVFIPPYTILEEDFMADEYWGEGDYDEEKDVYYTPSGWYEEQTEAEINWKLSNEVIFWAELPDKNWILKSSI
jgi:hypothetical protein